MAGVRILRGRLCTLILSWILSISFCFGSFHGPHSWAQSSGIPTTPLPPQDLPEALRAFVPYATDLPEVLSPGEAAEGESELDDFSAEMEVSEEEGQRVLNEVLAMTPEEFDRLTVQHKFGLISRILMMGHGGKLKRFIHGLMNRLSVEGDNPNYSVRFSPSLLPNAAIYPGKADMIVQAGLLAYASNVDEFAYVIAHEMTHDNAEFFQVMKDSREADEILNQVSGYSDLSPMQREEIRADIGAIERVIRAGYNPWGGYYFLRRLANFERKTVDSTLIRLAFRIFSKKSFDYWEAHPAAEIRMAAIKAYIVSKSQQQDLADNLIQENRFPVSLKLLRYRMAIVTQPLMSVWFHRSLYAYGGYKGLEYLYYALIANFATSTNLMPEIPAVDQTKETIGGIWDSVWQPFREVYQDSGMEALMDYLGMIINETTMVAQQNGKYIGLGLMMGLTAFSIYKGLREAYRNDPRHPDWIKMRQLYQEIRSQNPFDESASAVVKRVETLAEIAEIVDRIYHSYGLVRKFRKLNKVTWIRFRVGRLLSDQLDAIGQKIEAQPNFFSADQIETLHRQLNVLPAYVFESPRVQAALLKVYEKVNGYPLEITAQPARAEGELNWVYLLRLVTAAQNKAGLSQAEQIEVAHALSIKGAKDTAYKITGLLPESLVNFTYSQQNSNPELSRKMIDLVRDLKDGERSLHKSSWFGRRIQEAWVHFRRLTQITEDLSSKIVSQSFTQAIPYPGWRWVTLRNYTDLTRWASVDGRVDRSFHSIRDMVAFARQELLPRNVEQSFVSDIFARAVARNPEWVQTSEDIDLILEADYFWPTLAGTAVNFTPLESLFASSVSEMIRQYPNVWRYEPARAEKNHQAIIAALHRMGQYPEDVEGKQQLWLRLTNRGVTTTTDRLFHEAYEIANAEQRVVLEELALDEGRVWEPEIKTRIVRNRLSAFSSYIELLALPAGPQRVEKLREVIAFLERNLPERGRGFMEILEEISIHINSTREEDLLIHAAKTAGAGGERQEDFGLRVLSEILNHILSWKKRHQWAFVQYLRGEGPATPKIQAAFRTLGPERVRRMFELLPTMARTVTLDSFLDAPTGLLGKIRVGRGWSKTIVESLMQGKSEEETQIARELLTGFLYALKRTGNKPLQSYVISYMLALPKSQSGSSAETLKNVLEIFGTTGVKIGQFLAASNLLPEEQTRVLRSLQEQARIPERHEIYEDLEKIFGTSELPFDLKQLLGAASLKYAMLATEKETGEDVVLKILRLESVAHTRLEFMILEKMAEYLMKKNGQKYGVFRSIVAASRRAVERELVAQDEVNRTRLAARYVYVNASEADIEVRVPRELLVGNRITVSEYAEGISFFSLRPEFQTPIADKLLQMERDILFSEAPEILFDPDRHAGNYRIHVREFNGENYIVLESARITAIDFGQLLRSFTPADRNLIVDLFALAQIASHAGSNQFVAEQVAQRLPLTGAQKKRLRRALRMYFPSENLKPVTAYFAILSSIELAGYDMDIKYYDFVRAIIQLKQYEPYATEDRDWQTASELFESLVREKVEEFRPDISLNLRERLHYIWDHPQEALNWLEERWNSAFSRSSGDLIPQLQPEQVERGEEVDVAEGAQMISVEEECRVRLRFPQASGE